MNFQDYLISKRIDSDAFQKAEPKLWSEWSSEFGQMHPNSFTVQKLNLINPIRRKYLLKSLPEKAVEKIEIQTEQPKTESKPIVPVAGVKPTVPRPVFKPKPKTP